MAYLIWLLLCGGYGGFLWAAKRLHPTAAAALCFLDGIYLALLSLAILPAALGTPAFYAAALAAAAGIGCGFLAERRKQGRSWLSALLFAGFLGLALFDCGEIAGRMALPLAFFGGLGLYHACAGILPDGIPPAERIGSALLSGSGFLLGTLSFAVFL